MNKDEQELEFESALCELLYRWQEESDLDALDIVGVLERTKLNLYIEHKNQEIELE